MDIAELKASPREARGSRPARRLRRQGLLPAVLYGRGEPNVMLSVSEGDLAALLAEHTAIVNVTWDGESANAQIREVQYDALGDTLVHVDLVRISLTERIHVSVAVETDGTPAGAAQGGVLELIMHEIDVECLPMAVPESIHVEVAELGIGDNLTLDQVEFPEGVAPLADPGAVVCTLVPPLDVEAEVEEEEIAEPEIIGEIEELEEELDTEAPPEPGEPAE